MPNFESKFDDFMKKILKISAVVVALLLAVILIVPVALSGRIGDIVKREANAMLNAKVDFEKLNISLFRHFPKASLELVDFSVTGVGNFEGQTLVGGKRVEVAVDLLSIFGESFEVSKVWLLEPEIYGVIAKDGSVNWDILKPSDAPEEPSETVEEQTTSEESSSFKLSIEGVSIEDAKLYYTDNQSDMHFHTAPASLYLSGDLSAATTTLTLAAKAADITFVSGKESYASGLTAALDGAVEADLQNNKYRRDNPFLLPEHRKRGHRHPSYHSSSAIPHGWKRPDQPPAQTPEQKPGRCRPDRCRHKYPPRRELQNSWKACCRYK